MALVCIRKIPFSNGIRTATHAPKYMEPVEVLRTRNGYNGLLMYQLLGYEVDPEVNKPQWFKSSDFAEVKTDREILGEYFTEQLIERIQIEIQEEQLITKN